MSEATEFDEMHARITRLQLAGAMDGFGAMRLHSVVDEQERRLKAAAGARAGAKGLKQQQKAVVSRQQYRVAHGVALLRGLSETVTAKGLSATDRAW